MKKIIFITVTSLFFVLLTGSIFSQEKKTSDIFNGFREFKFYTPITDYYNYNYRLVNKYGNTTFYEIILPYNESQFLETRIKKVLVKAYKNKIYKITLILETDIENILSKMFEHTYPLQLLIMKSSDEEKLQFQKYLRNGKHITTTELFKWQKPQLDTLFDKTLIISGLHTNMHYGSIKIYKEYSKKMYSYFSRRYTLFLNAFYLTFEAEGFQENIDGKQVQEHYDSYLGDFGVKHNPSDNNKQSYYRIPLFEFDNVYYVRAMFGDIIENLILDTGADQLIISNNLYKKLKSKNLLTDENSSRQMVIANGNTVNLKKVIVKNLQLNNLKIDFIEAYVNTSDDISLLGQSFLKRFGGISIDYKTNILTIKK